MRQNSPTQALVATAATFVTAACAVVVAVAAAKVVFWPPPPPPPPGPQSELQPDWADYAGQGRRLGSRNPQVLLVEFSDFQCGACRVLDTTLRAVLRDYPDDVALVYRHYPLNRHTAARPAAIASECAGRQGRFEAMHQLLFAWQDSLERADFSVIAAAAAVPDSDAFRRCLSDPGAADVIEQDILAAKRLDVRGTPTLLVQETRFNSTVPYRTIDSLVRRAMGLKPAKQ